nr:MAG TPA: hypothetical protein [Caudoviricetes sp.]
MVFDANSLCLYLRLDPAMGLAFIFIYNII